MHKQCYNELISNGQFKCPLCMKLIVKENTELKDLEQKMYPFDSLTVVYSCYECHEVNKGECHIVGNKCLKCGSYNTHLIDI
jgi:hypothetical protein